MFDKISSPVSLKGLPICVYGTGGRTASLLAEADKLGLDLDIRFYLDTFTEGRYQGKPVRRLDQVADSELAECDLVVIASTYFLDIAASLKKREVTACVIYDEPVDPILTRLICDALPDGERFTLLYVGAREFDSSFSHEWKGMPRDRLRVYGFDPDISECARMNGVLTSWGMEGTFFPLALWSSRDRIPFRVMDQPPCSSCLEPNTELLSRLRGSFPGHEAEKWFRVVDTTMIDTTSLDHWKQTNTGLSRVDFVQLDTQGSEMEILKGGSGLLGEILCLKTEAWFQEFYRGQALFSDIDLHLRSRGFGLFCLEIGGGAGRSASPVNYNRILHKPISIGQPTQTDAVYFKDVVAGTPENLSYPSLLKLAALAEQFGQIEFAFEVLVRGTEWLEKNGSPDQTRNIRRIVEEGAAGYQALYRT